MLLALSGVTGIGKSYFKERLVEDLNFHKVNTIRTRPIRIGEKNGVDGIFITDSELDELKKQNKIVYDFKVFGGRYAYLKDEIFSDDNMVFEMHYTRNLSKEKEIERINEIDEQYNRFMNDKVFQSKFDYILYNNYDKKSEEQLLNLIRNLISK